MDTPSDKGEEKRMFNVLVLEDSSVRNQAIQQVLIGVAIPTFTQKASECITLLSQKQFDLVLLDHDLDDRENVSPDELNTGSEVVRYIERHGLNCDPIFIVHSMNTPAAIKMTDNLKKFGFTAHRIPYNMMIRELYGYFEQ